MEQIVSEDQVIITGTSSDLSREVWVTAYRGDAYWTVNL